MPVSQHRELFGDPGVGRQCGEGVGGACPVPAGPCRGHDVPLWQARVAFFVNGAGGSGGRRDSGSLSPESPPRAGSRPPTPAWGLHGDTRHWTRAVTTPRRPLGTAGSHSEVLCTPGVCYPLLTVSLPRGLPTWD